MTSSYISPKIISLYLGVKHGSGRIHINGIEGKGENKKGTEASDLPLITIFSFFFFQHFFHILLIYSFSFGLNKV